MKYVGLSNRLIVVLIAIEAIVMAVVAWGGGGLLEESYSKQLERDIERESQVLVTALTEGLIKLDRSKAQHSLSDWQGRGDILYIALLDHKMNVVASLNQNASVDIENIPDEGDSSFIKAINDGTYHLSLPVMLKGERIGTVKVGYNTSDINQSISRAQWQSMLALLLLLMILALLTFVVGSRFTTNLRRIERGIEEFQHGNFEYHINSEEDGLFGDIAGAMNRFARDIRNKMGDLNVGNERLQESVEALQLEITAKNQTESELRTLQQRMLLQREQSPIGIIDWSTDFTVMDWNPAAEKIFGYTREEALGQSALGLIVSSEIKEEGFDDNWLYGLMQSGGEQSVHENVAKDGRTISCEWYNTPVVNESGEMIGVFSLIVDITEKRKQQQMLQRSQKMDALGKLTGGIAHDYNNMLGVILGYASMLKKMLSDQPKLANYAEQIHHAGERGAALSKKLLAFSRNLSSEPEEIDINALLLGEKLMLEKTLTARIKLVFALANDSWPIWIDQSDLVDAILNMSINAMHAMPTGGQLSIHTQNLQLSRSYADSMGITPGEYMVLSITDTGAGIDQEVQAHIFEPFYTTKGEEGSGLGLSQVYGFMQRAKGGIRLYSDLGHGSRFTLYFPRYRHDEEPQQLKVSDSHAAKSDQSERPGQGEIILVVDDEAGLRTVSEDFLGSAGYQVLTAKSGEEALEILESEHVDLLLSDVVMPEMDGFQLAAKVRTLYPEIQIQMASGYNDERHQGYATKDLQERMLRKPFELDVLLERVRELLDKSELETEQETAATSGPLYLEFTEDNQTGVGEIDDDHRVLFELLNRCQSLLTHHVPPSEMRKILNELLDYTKYHFRREEAIMEVCDYPHRKNHQLVHGMLTKQVTQLVEEYDKGELQPAKLLDFLIDWLLDHIMTMDKAIAPYCEDRDVDIAEALKR